MLYEVITDARRRGIGVVARTTLESGLLTGAFAPGRRFAEPDQRARYDPANLDFVLGQVARIVITSYSIHYTKLYEANGRIPFFSRLQVGIVPSLQQILSYERREVIFEFS